MVTNNQYRGRFAPSPTGALHFGSIVTALASYLDAKANNGVWLLRIEDIDPLREEKGARDRILTTLEIYGLEWDDLIYQHDRLDAYYKAAEELRTRGVAYPCTCTKKNLRPYNGRYPGTCRNIKSLPNKRFSIRANCGDNSVCFSDRIQGKPSYNMKALGDCNIVRKDGLIAYQLAVTLDDAWMGITHIVRGMDLLESTSYQICLQNLLSITLRPVYSHIPIIVNNKGFKLSKQHGAPAIDDGQAKKTLTAALEILIAKDKDKLKSLAKASLKEMLNWAVEYWSINSIPKRHFIIEKKM